MYPPSREGRVHKKTKKQKNKYALDKEERNMGIVAYEKTKTLDYKSRRSPGSN